MKKEFQSELYRFIQRYHKNVTNRIAFLEKHRASLPSDDNIKYYQLKSTLYYSHRSAKSNKNHYIKRKDLKKIIPLVNAQYADAALPILKSNRAAAEAFLNLHSATEEKFIAQSYPREIQNFNSKLYPCKADLIEQWQNTPYERNPYKRENEIYDSTHGEKLRSKSEVFIANGLYQNGLPYKPECPLILGGRKLYPDFTILNPNTMTEIIWEHFGMMDSPDYALEAYKKIRLYNANGYYIGKNLICTFETSESPLNPKIVSDYINEYILKTPCINDLVL